MRTEAQRKMAASRYQNDRLNPTFLEKRAAYKKEWNRSHRYGNWPSIKASAKRYYQKNKAKINESTCRRYQHTKNKIKEYLSVHPCVDCGFTDVRCLDFDHVRGEKLFTIGKSFTFKWERILSEIGKCEVRCANCHRIRHYGD